MRQLARRAPCPSSSRFSCRRRRIWSPEADGSRRPVFFWIHGGAFLGGGSAAPSNGAELAAPETSLLSQSIIGSESFGFANFGNALNGSELPSAASATKCRLSKGNVTAGTSGRAASSRYRCAPLVPRRHRGGRIEKIVKETNLALFLINSEQEHKIGFVHM